MATTKTTSKTAPKHKTYKWDVRSWRASMTDVTEYRVWLYNKNTDIPYFVRLTFYDRDSGKKEYQAVIQGKVADDVRAWWHINTFYIKEGTFKSIKSVVTATENAITKLGKSLTYISMSDYSDWNENHPITKKRRLANDYGIFATNKSTSYKGWFDKVYGEIYEKNKYATRYTSEAEAKKDAEKLAKNNPGWKFEVKKMGKLDD